MRYIPCWKQIGISRERYMELLHFCRQYPEWKSEASALLGVRPLASDGQPKGTGKGDPVSMAAERREALMRKIAIVDECAVAVGNGDWYASIIQNVCMGKPYTVIDATLMPTADRNTFFRNRREFFALLDKKTEN